jgi:hypothetical protein
MYGNALSVASEARTGITRAMLYSNGLTPAAALSDASMPEARHNPIA